MPTLMGSINVIARCARLYRNDKLRKYGIHGTMDAIILHVCKNPGMSQDGIARRVCIDKSNVARKVARLCELGFISRIPSERDRRVQLVYPTEKGEELCVEIKRILREWSEEVTGDIPEEQAELVLAGLEKILLCARAYADGREEVEE